MLSGKILLTVIFLSLLLPVKAGKPIRELLTKGLTSGPNSWQLAMEKNGIKVYTRPREGSSIKEFMGVVVVEGSVPQLVAILQDNTIVPQWMYHTSKGELIRKISDMEWDNYYQNFFPFPVGKRDMALRFKMSQGAGKKVSLLITSIPGAVKPENGYTRIKNAGGEITLSPLGNGETTVTYQFFADPGGYIPVFLINAFVTDDPYNTLYNLRELLKTHIHKDAAYPFISE